MRRNPGQLFSGVLVSLFFSPGLGLAQWTGWFQWGTEGSYVHQIAHLLFLGAMLFFIYEMRREGLQRYRGFRSLIWACWLLALWNLDAFVGHVSEWALIPTLQGQGLSQRLVMSSPNAWLFYITQLDHFLLLIPAFYLVYRGLKAFAQEPETGKR
jgi:hypothetical protein